MSKETELAEVVRLHKEWLDSGNKTGKRADLSGAQLKGVDLSNTDLSGALLRGSHLESADFTNSKLYHTDFSDADVKRANFSGSILVLADFSGADMEETDLSGIKCSANTEELGQNRRGPRFTDANLTRAKFNASYCFASDFRGANLQHTCFNEANLEQANFSNNDLSGLDFSFAMLIDAKMHDSKMPQCNFYHTNLANANLRNTNLLQADICEANLTSANLERCKVDGIKYNRKTLFRGIRIEGCYGSSRFKRFAEDQDFIEEFREAHPIAYTVWLGLTDCGRSMTRVGLWSLTFSVCFGLIYFSLGQQAFEISNPDGLKWSIFTMIYYSFVTFTTLGFGDITPNTPTAAGVVVFEVVIGYIMLGILISILATKVARRS